MHDHTGAFGDSMAVDISFASFVDTFGIMDKK
jgi:hypothetical protein